MFVNIIEVAVVLIGFLKTKWPNDIQYIVMFRYYPPGN